MSLFGKKNQSENQAATATPAATDTAQTSAPRKLKSEMEDFFDVSVPDNVLETFDANTNYFSGDKRADTAFYVGMLLHTEDVGGFNKKTKGNADKGRIIEAVRGGNIDAYVTPEQNEAGELIFIPNEKTFNFIEEFSMLTDVEYEVVKIHTRTGAVTKTGNRASFIQFRKPIKDPLALVEILGGIGSAPANAPQSISPLDIMPPRAGAAAAVPPPIAANPTSVSAAGTGATEQPVPNPAFIPPPPPTPPVIATAANVPKQANKAKPAAAQNSVPIDSGEPVDAIYTEGDVQRAVSRIYHAEGLNLEVTSVPFEQIFVEGNKQILFDENQKDGFVDGELNRMAKNANVEIRRLREKHMQNMREYFLTMVSESAAMTQKKYDIHDPSTDCGRQKAELDDKRRDKVDNLDAIVSEKKKELETEYATQRRIAQENAARKAADEYNIKYGRLHADKLENLSNKIREGIESEYNRDLREIYYTRQDRAVTSFDYITTELLKHISSDMFVKMVKEEDALYAKHIETLETYAHTLHKEDARRTMIEEERLRIQHDVTEAHDEMTSKINALTESFEAAKRALTAEHETEVALLQEKAKVLRIQMEERVTALEKEKEALTENLAESRGQYAHAIDEARGEYKSQVDVANRNVEQWQTLVGSLEEQYKHHNKLAIVIMIAVVIAAIAIGFIVGGIWYKENDAVISDTVSETSTATTVTSGTSITSDTDTGVKTSSASVTTSSNIVTSAPATITSATTKVG
jgi:hypothetical protein